MDLEKAFLIDDFWNDDARAYGIIFERYRYILNRIAQMELDGVIERKFRIFVSYQK